MPPAHDATHEAGTAYAKKKAYAQEKSREIAHAGREIGPLPEVANPLRRKACERDFRAFCETYMAATFSLEWSDDHLRAIARAQTCVLSGGQFALAMPRGSGKTSLCEGAALWAGVYGHRHFVVPIGASETHAEEILDHLASELEHNDELADDFPEVCFPIRALEGIANRAKGQILDGERTMVTWTKNMLVLPTVAGSVASGTVFKVAGITGRIRGMSYKRSDGRSIRPDLVLCDDPQTDESARSMTQCQTRERIVASAVLGLGGPRDKIAALMPCTVIRPGDMADNLLDRKKHPEWNGERTKLIYEIPTSPLWEKYAELRVESFRNHGDIRDATAFYAEHREEMDAGAKVAWPVRFLPDQLSAVQYAMDLRIADEASFMSEYQNDPLPEVGGGELEMLTPDAIAAKLNGYAERVVPVTASRLTAFIDVQQDLLYWIVCAWGDDFTGYVLAYGAWPDQHREYFTLNDAQPTLAHATPRAGREGAIRAGLDKLASELLGREWIKDDGTPLRVGRALVDASWGESTPTVYAFCRETPHAAVVTPSHGKYIGPSTRPMSEWTKKPGDKIGNAWRVPAGRGRREVEHALYDTNYWKSFVHARLAQAQGDPGSLSLFGRSPRRHRMLAEHLTAERRERLVGTQRTVDVWSMRPGARDNHLFDCYDAETDVLTRTGWKRFAVISSGDELATVNLESDSIEYQRPTALIARQHSGEMVQIGGGPNARVDLCVTPTHRMVAWEGQSSKGPLFKRAEALSAWDKLKIRSTWSGSGSARRLVPATARHLAVEILSTDLAAFLGWYVSEGSCRINRGHHGLTHVVLITQVKAHGRASIRKLLERLPWAFHETRRGFVLSNQQVFDLVVELGKQPDRFIPQWIKDSTPDVIARFVQAAVDGDGWRSNGHEAYATISRRLADDMQELYLKLGFGVSASVVAAKPYHIRGRSGTNTRDQYHVHRSTRRWAMLRDSRNRPNYRRVAYEGAVYCATVPNGTLIVRRGGKVAVCGNCAVGAAVAASMIGVSLPGLEQPKQKPRERVKLSELQRGRRAL